MMFWNDDVDFTQIQGCCTWIDFTDKNTITFRTGTTYIGEIKDKSGYGNNFSQTIESKQPALAGSFNGKTVAYFTGASFTTLAGVRTNQYIGIYNNDHEIFITFKSATASSFPQFLLASNETTEVHEVHLGIAGTLGLRYIPNTGIYVDTTTPCADANQHVGNFRIASNMSSLNIDGNEIITRPGGYTTATVTLSLGLRSSGFAYTGTIGQLLIYNRSLEASERAAIIKMLQRY